MIGKSKINSLASKVAVASAAAVSSVSAFADTVTDITAQVTTSLASATTIATAVGLGLITLGFLTFLLRKGQRASNGRV